MNLYAVSLITIFGRDSERPLRTALFKVAAMVVASVVAGFALGQGVPSFPVMRGQGWAHFLLEVTFGSQLAILIVLISAAGVINRQSQFNSFLMGLPITLNQRGKLLFIPRLVLITCALGLIIPGFIHLVPYNEQVLPLLAAILLGTLSAVGIAHPPRRQFIYRLAAIAILIAEYKLLQSAQDPGSILKLIIILTLFIYSVFLSKNTFKNIALTSHRTTKARYIKTANLPHWLWMAKKAWRSRNIQLGFLVTVILSAGLAFVGHREPLVAVTYSGLFGQMLAGAFASDLRSTTQRYNPAEISALKGTGYFTANVISIGILGALLGTTPLILSFLVDNLDVSLLIARLLAGTSIGLAVGFLLVPASHDISAQLSSTLACLGLMLAFSHLALGGTNPALLYLILTLVMLSIPFIIEYKRNPYSWRPHAKKEI